MGLFLRFALLFLISVQFFCSPCFARVEVSEKKSDLEKALDGLRETLGDESAVEEIPLPDDTSPRFLVKQVRISGNSLVRTSELISDLPLVYVKKVQKGDKDVEERYDFRAIRELLLSSSKEVVVSLRTINGLANYFLSVYQEKGYIGIYVYIPASAVSVDGKLVDQILPIEVLEGRVSEVQVERYDFDRQTQEKGYLNDGLIKKWSPIKPGQVIKKKKLDDYVGQLNRNPDRYVSAVITRSANPNALNLGYDVYESNPWHWYVQTDNSGTENRRWSPRVGLINTNLTGIDDRFSFMYQSRWDDEIDDQYALFGSYDFPLFWPCLRLSLYGGYSEFDTPGIPGINFLGNGSFYGGKLSYNFYQTGKWFFDLTGSLSHEESKVTPTIGVATDIDMDLLGIGITVHRTLDLSSTSFSFDTVTNVSGTDDRDLQVQQRNEAANFTIYNFSASHNRYIDPNKINRVSGRIHLIKPDQRLVPAKMTTFGGLYSVRGYKEEEIVADGGIIASLQYELDLVKCGQSSENGETESGSNNDNPFELTKLAPVAFLDYGRAEMKDPVVGERDMQDLCSVGTGAIVEVGDNFTGTLYYGWPLRETDETEKYDGRLNLSFIYRF
jgi:hemolysin activation/secretion protein